MTLDNPSPAMVRYVVHLRELSVQQAHGPDGDYCDWIRDAMDGPWFGMSEEERDRTREISGEYFRSVGPMFEEQAE